jgi:hypothetical protein
MTSVQDYLVCKQCKYPFANYIYECGDSSEWFSCPRCGHHTESGPVYDQEAKDYVYDPQGKLVWKNNDLKGFGAYCYQPTGHIAYCIGSVDPEQFEELKKSLEDGLNEGKLQPEPFYLTRWNETTQQVELVLGQFPPDPSMERAAPEEKSMQASLSGDDWEEIPF